MKNKEDSEQFRQFFADDTELHTALPAGIRREDALGPFGKPDNWLVARQWFLHAEPLAAKEFGIDRGGKSPLVFYSSAPMCRIQYATAIEKDGEFGDVAKAAWSAGANEWRDYSNKEIPTSFLDESRKPIVIRLADEEMHRQAAAKLLAQLNACPSQEEAKKLAKQAEAEEQMATYIRRYREIVNLNYWQSRCQAEQLPSTLLARRLIFEAQRELKKGRLDSQDPDKPGAKQLFEQGFQAWKQSLVAYPMMEDNEIEEVGKELAGVIMLYRQNLLKDRPLPEDFPLKGFFERWTQRADNGKK